MEFVIDQMHSSDWEQVATIYQQGMDTGLATFEQVVPAYDKWDASHLESCRLVARRGGKVLGWAALSPTSSRCCYRGVAEHSVYVAPLAKGQGVGTALLTALLKASEEAGFWTVQSGITSGNKASLALHQKCGFRVIGYREKIGQMADGTWHDVVLVERRSKVVGVE